MKLAHAIGILAISAAVGVLAGWWLRAPVPTAHQLVPNTNEELQSPTGLVQKASAVQPDHLETLSGFEHELVTSQGVTRWLLWMDRIEKSGTNDFPRLARLARLDPRALRMLASHWAEVDPQGLFDLLSSSDPAAGLPLPELSEVLLEQWRERDLNAMIAALEKAPPSQFQQGWRMNAINQCFKTDPQKGIELMFKWSINNYLPRMDGVAKWAAKNPRPAAEFALAHPAGYASDAILKTIGGAWGKSDPGSAVNFGLERGGKLGETLAGAALKTWAESALNEAAKWLAGTDRASRNRLSVPFVEAWAKSDPAAALFWAENNLSDSALNEAAAGALKEAAAKDGEAAARLVSAMKPSRARGQAAAAVADAWRKSKSGAVERPVPPEVLDWMRGLDPEAAAGAIEKLYFTWSQTDAAGMAAFLAEQKNPHVSDHIYSTVARDVARTNPEHALAWAADLPEDYRWKAGTEAFTHWYRAQPESAGEWLRALPGEDARKAKFFEGMVRSLAFDRHQGAAALAALTAEDRAAAIPILERMSLPRNDREQLLKAIR